MSRPAVKTLTVTPQQPVGNAGSSRWQGGLSASHSDIEFTNRDEELQQDNISINFSRRDRLGRLSGRIGHTWLSSEQNLFISDSEAVTGSLAYHWQFETGTRASFQVRRDLTDASTDIDVDIPGLEFNLQETTAVQVTAVSASVTKPLPQASSFTLAASFTESDYLSANLRRKAMALIWG